MSDRKRSASGQGRNRGRARRHERAGLARCRGVAGLGTVESGWMSDWLAEQLQELRARSLDRHLCEIASGQGAIIELAGKRAINFSSNDYLALANDPKLREAASEAIGDFGVGAGASR